MSTQEVIQQVETVIEKQTTSITGLPDGAGTDKLKAYAKLINSYRQLIATVGDKQTAEDRLRDGDLEYQIALNG